MNISSEITVVVLSLSPYWLFFIIVFRTKNITASVITCYTTFKHFLTETVHQTGYCPYCFALYCGCCCVKSCSAPQEPPEKRGCTLSSTNARHTKARRSSVFHKMHICIFAKWIWGGKRKVRDLHKLVFAAFAMVTTLIINQFVVKRNRMASVFFLWIQGSGDVRRNGVNGTWILPGRRPAARLGTNRAESSSFLKSCHRWNEEHLSDCGGAAMWIITARSQFVPSLSSGRSRSFDMVAAIQSLHARLLCRGEFSTRL